MTNWRAILAPYEDFIEADASAGRMPAMELIVAREMVEMCPVGEDLQQTMMAKFGVWLGDWEARLQ